MQKELKTLGLKSPVKILVVGKKPDEEDESYQLMKKWESSCDSSAQKLNAIQHDVEDMEKVYEKRISFWSLLILDFFFAQGYAPKQLLDENLPKMEKKINIVAEELMKVLISLGNYFSAWLYCVSPKSKLFVFFYRWAFFHWDSKGGQS